MMNEVFGCIVIGKMVREETNALLTVRGCIAMVYQGVTRTHVLRIVHLARAFP